MRDEDENAAIQGERVDFILRYAFLPLPSLSLCITWPRSLCPCELAALTDWPTIQITFIVCTETDTQRQRGLKSSGGCTQDTRGTVHRSDDCPTSVHTEQQRRLSVSRRVLFMAKECSTIPLASATPSAFCICVSTRHPTGGHRQAGCEAALTDFRVKKCGRSQRNSVACAPLSLST